MNSQNNKCSKCNAFCCVNPPQLSWVGKEKIDQRINDYELKCKVGFFDNGKKKTRV